MFFKTEKLSVENYIVTLYKFYKFIKRAEYLKSKLNLNHIIT